MIQNASLFSSRHKGKSFALQPNCVIGWVVCGTIYGDMHHKDLQVPIVIVG